MCALVAISYKITGRNNVLDFIKVLSKTNIDEKLLK